MYLPAHFREERPEILDAFIADHPLATIIVATPDGMVANHMPVQLQRFEEDRVVLRGHIARGNTLWKAATETSPVLAIFGGAEHYITPGWYPAKKEHGKVVPTWNYSVVHAHGFIRFIDGIEEKRDLVSNLTDKHEASQAQPWAITDAPDDYIQGMLAAIVGFEIRVDRLEAKFKASQNRNEADRKGVELGLTELDVHAAARRELVRPPSI